jgi:hypothetical protein
VLIPPLQRRLTINRLPRKTRPRARWTQFPKSVIWADRSTKSSKSWIMKFNQLHRIVFLGAFFALMFATAGLRAGTVAYTYDSAGRLLSANYGAGVTSAYAYDPSGNLLYSSAPAPALIYELGNGGLTIMWPVSASGFILQAAGVLGNSSAWAAVQTQAAQSGNLFSLTVPFGNGPMFYRLRSP